MIPALLSLVFSAQVMAQDVGAEDAPAEVPAPEEPEEPAPGTPPDGVNEPLTPIDSELEKPQNPEARRGPPGRRGKGPPKGQALSPERLRSLRAYKNKSLSIRRETEVQGGGYGRYSSIHMGYRVGPVMIAETIHANPITTTRTWGIYRGPERITTPQFLKIVNDTSALETLEAEVASLRKRSKTAFTVAGVGGAGVFLGIMGMSVSHTNPSAYRTWNTVALTGSLASLGGMIAGSLPSSKASQMVRHPRTTMTPAEAQERIDSYNESLRDQLGLTPEEVWLMEMGDS